MRPSSAPVSSARSTSRRSGASASRFAACSAPRPSAAPPGPTPSASPAPTTSLDELLERPARRRRPRHVAQRPAPPADPGDPRRRPPRRVREAARDDGRGVGAAGRGGREAGARQRRQLQHPLLPAEPARPRRRRAAASSATSGWSPAATSRTGCSSRRDWNWRLEPDRGGALRAVGDIGSHWLDLMTFMTGQRVAAVMADLATFIEARHEPTGPVETFSTERPTDTVTRRIATEDTRLILLRFDERRPRGGEHLADQRRAEELAPVRDRWLGRGRSRGTRSSPTRCGSATVSGRTRS